MNQSGAMACLVGGVSLIACAGAAGSANRIFSGIREAHEHYGYPGSYQYGVIVSDGLVVRAYANGDFGDIVKDGGKVVYYGLKSDAIRPAFRRNKELDQQLRFFIRSADGVEDMGLYRVDRFYDGKVKLVKVGT